MKKYFIMAAAVLATFTACQQNEPENVFTPTREIQFATATTTRAAMDEVNATDLEEEGFAVLGMADDATIFGTQGGQGTNVYLKGNNNSQATVDGAWAPATAAEVKYWSTTATYAFAAYHPISTTTQFTLTKDGNKVVNSYTNDGTTDFVISDFITPFKLESGTTTATPVALNFKHMLSRVKFTFENGFDDTDVEVKVTNIKLLNVGKVGKVETFTSNVPTWEITDADLDLAYENLTVLTSETQEAETEYMTVIPQTASLKVEFTIEALADGKSFATIVYADDDADTEHNAIPLTEQAFVPGQGYDFKAVINVTKVGEVYPIEFNVTVEKWQEPTTETVIPGFGDE